jgi:hypothetical protein
MYICTTDGNNQCPPPHKQPLRSSVCCQLSEKQQRCNLAGEPARPTMQHRAWLFSSGLSKSLACCSRLAAASKLLRDAAAVWVRLAFCFGHVTALIEVLPATATAAAAAAPAAAAKEATHRQLSPST